jgi:hypothetical protein
MPRRTWATLASLYADNATGDITAERLRDGFDSVTPHESASAPTSSDDSSLGYDVGHVWLHTTPDPVEVYQCVSSAAGAAVWLKVYPSPGDVPASRLVATQHSLTGGGDLTSDRTLALVGDTASPGANKVYGTNSSGERTWKDDPAGGGGGGGGIEPSEGVLVVTHGSSAGTARPTAAIVYWIGSVAPTNRETGDLWLQT